MSWELVLLGVGAVAWPILGIKLLIPARNRWLIRQAEALDPVGSVEVARQDDGLRFPIRVLRLEDGSPQLSFGEAQLPLSAELREALRLGKTSLHPSGPHSLQLVTAEPMVLRLVTGTPLPRNRHLSLAPETAEALRELL